MSDRDLRWYRQQCDILEEQIKATEEQYLVDTNPATRVLLGRQRDQLKAQLSEVVARIAELEKSVYVPPPPPPVPTKRVLLTSAVPQTFADFDLPEAPMLRDYGYFIQPEKWITAPRLLNRLRDEPYHVWHHHGYCHADSLVICDMQKRPAMLSFTDINIMFDQLPEIPRVVWVIEGDPAPILIDQMTLFGIMELVIVPAGISAPTRHTFLGALYDQLRLMPIQEAYHHARQVAQTDMPILLVNHSDTGDES